MTAHVVAIAVASAALVAAAEAAAAPSISVQPTSSPPGRLVTVTGRGFCSAPGCSGVRIFVFGNPVADDVRVTARGTFVRRVRVPGVTSPEENGVLVVQRRASGAESSAFADFQVLLRIDPPQPPPAPTTAAPQATTTPQPPRTVTGETTQPPATTAPESDEIPTTPADTETNPPTALPPTGQSDTGEGGLSWPWLALLGVLTAVAAAGALAVGRARRGSREPPGRVE